MALSAMSCARYAPMRDTNRPEPIGCVHGGIISWGSSNTGVSPIHPVARLPKSFIGLPNGHWGSHQFLVDDCVTACVADTLPPNNVWQAARYTAPGIIAHESAMRGGELLAVPDFGDPIPRE